MTHDTENTIDTTAGIRWENWIRRSAAELFENSTNKQILSITLHIFYKASSVFTVVASTLIFTGA